MSIQVDVKELAATLEKYDFAYLVTVSGEHRSHVVACRPLLEGEALKIGGLGRRTSTNLSARPAITLVYPPTEPDGYTLLVDGHASADGDSVSIEPQHAVLHRPADHGHECVPVAEL